ncbi:MAG: hypothetical protein COV44_06970, partial [Deltaproteobacteria bacterium CG11_big_fil_rev_8_21_14_0_20_45_16]
RKIPAEWIDQIEAVIFMVDASESPNSLDRECLDSIRKLNRPFLVVANKADRRSFAENLNDYAKMTGKSPIEVSVEKKEGLKDLEEIVLSTLLPLAHKDESKTAQKAADLKILILGRPNSGKSSLINRLAGTKISMVSEIPGTTRDSIECRKKIKNKEWEFVDSAGVRKKAKIYGKHSDPVEIFSSLKAMEELKRCDLCILLIEPHARALMATQDKKLLRLVRESLVPTLLAVNKWDLMKEDWKDGAYRSELRRDLGEMYFLPSICISAKTGYHIKHLLDELIQMEARRKKIPTSQLNKWLEKIQRLKQPRVAKRGIQAKGLRTPNQYLKYNYMVQTGESPMSFQIFCNAPQSVPKDEKRFIENSMRESFDLGGLPLSINFRAKSKGKTFSIRSKSR